MQLMQWTAPSSEGKAVADTCAYCGKPLGGSYQSYWGNLCHYECNPDNIREAKAREVQRQIGRDESKKEVARLTKALTEIKALGTVSMTWAMLFPRSVEIATDALKSK